MGPHLFLLLLSMVSDRMKAFEESGPHTANAIIRCVAASGFDNIASYSSPSFRAIRHHISIASVSRWPQPQYAEKIKQRTIKQNSLRYSMQCLDHGVVGKIVDCAQQP
ncbi:hypothetical protein BC567DRAFT_229080 [Phyllosticta citribraziliensis]